MLPFLSERIKETLSGTGAALVVKVYGDDLPALDRAAQDVARVLGALKGRDGKPAAGNFHRGCRLAQFRVVSER